MSLTPTPEQARAIESRAASILLEAGAGTGKTSVLVDRYCDRIERDGIGPERLLAFTFTDKAAAQLRERIRHELRERAARPDTPPETATTLREAAARIGGAWVMTIHAFCRKLLASHPVAAGIDPAFSVLDGPEAERIARDAFDRAVEDLLDPASARAAVEAGGEAEPAARRTTVATEGIDALRRSVTGIHAQLRGRGRLHPELPEAPEPDPWTACDGLVEAAREFFDGGHRAHAEADRKISEAVAIASGERDWIDGDRRAMLGELEALTSSPKPTSPRFPVAEALRRLIACLYEIEEGMERYRHLSELLEAFTRHFEEAKRARSGLDFEDLQLMATDLLRRHPGIGAAYRERFVEIMVDEFQDTSPSQVALIEAIRGEETGLFQVGDELQSIYRFRHADLASFRRERKRLEDLEGGSVLALRGNFRSRSAILSLANHLGPFLLDGYKHLTVGSPEQVARKPRGGGSGVELILTAPEGWDEDPDPPEIVAGEKLERAAEARAVAERLAELAAAGVPRGEMVVLLRARTAAETFATALDRVGLRPFVVGGRGFWHGRSVVDAVALLASVANPLDDEALLGAISSPACAASPDALWLLRRSAGDDRRPYWHSLRYLAGDSQARAPAEPEWIERLAAEDREALIDLHGRITELRRLVPETGLESLVLRAVSLTGLDLAALDGPRGDAALASLEKLARLAGEFEASEGRDLRGFLDYAATQAEEGTEAEAAIAAEGHDGVRVMTIHNAKGLEFPVVVVAELGRRLSSSGNRSPAIRVSQDGGEGEPEVGMRLARIGREPVGLFEMPRLAEEEKDLEAEEEMRLFHVAMTRAEERLILSGVAGPPPSDGVTRSTSILARILDRWNVEVEKEGPPPEVEPPVLAPPEPRQGLEADLSPVRPEIRLNWPETGNDAARSRRSSAEKERREDARPAAGVATAVDETTPSDGRSPPAPAGSLLEPLPEPAPPLPRLSFTTLAAHARDPHGFRRRRLLGLDDPGAAAEEAEPATPAAAEDWSAGGEVSAGAEEGTRFGSAVHRLLEQAVETRGARNRWRAPARGAIEAALTPPDGRPDPEEAERAEAQIAGWISSELCAETARPGVSLRSEAPFFLHLDHDRAPGALIRGAIDLLAEPPDGPPLIVDFKTNRLAGRTPEEVAKGYELQKLIYAAAVARATGAEAVRVAFAFLDAPADPVVAQLDSVAVAASETELRDRVSALINTTAHS